MAGFKGADVDLLRQFGLDLEGKANQIQTIISAVDRMVNNDLPGIWKGPDAQKFASIWQGTSRGAMNKAADALRIAGGDAKRNAQKQEDASSRY